MWLCSESAQTFDYYIDVSPPPDQVNSSSTITITCYEDKSLRVAIPSDVIWTKINQGWSKKLPNHGHAYVCTPNDIGSIIDVEVTGRHPYFEERKSFNIKFGPIVLDPLLRPTLELALKNCVSSYQINVSLPKKTKQFILHISDIDIQIKDPRTGSNIKSTYSAIEPQFIESTIDSTIINLIVPKQNQSDYVKFFGITPSEKQTSIKLKFSDRLLRDSFVLTRKVFVVKRQIRMMNIIQNSIDRSVSHNNSVDILLEMSTFRIFNEFLYKKKQMYKGQVQILQEEIKNIKSIYENLLQQKINKISKKSKFDPLLSLLDSSDTNSRRLGFGNSQIFHNFQNTERPLQLPVIGQVSEIRHHFEQQVRINISTQNVMYSQVYPFNSEAYSKKLSEERQVIHETIYERNNTIPQKSIPDSQSILNSSTPLQSIQAEYMDSNLVFDIKPNKQQLYFALKQQTDKNLKLQQKINELERQMAMAGKVQSQIVESRPPQYNNYIQQLRQKETIIELMTAENANLKLQVDASNSIKQSYKHRCQKLEGELQIQKIESLQYIEDFKQNLRPYVQEADELLKESTHLNGLLRQAIGHTIQHKIK